MTLSSHRRKPLVSLSSFRRCPQTPRSQPKSTTRNPNHPKNHESRFHSNPLLRPASLAAIALTLVTQAPCSWIPPMPAAPHGPTVTAPTSSIRWKTGQLAVLLSPAETLRLGTEPWPATLTLTYNASFGVSPLGTAIDITSSQNKSLSIASTNAAANLHLPSESHDCQRGI